jgi:hypothetical protein
MLVRTITRFEFFAMALESIPVPEFLDRYIVRKLYYFDAIYDCNSYRSL